MGCGYSTGSSSRTPVNDPDAGIKLLMGVGFFFIIYLLTVIAQIFVSKPKTKITDYYPPKKNEIRSSKGPYKHVED